MRLPPPEKVSQLLLDWSKGDKAALDALVPLVHEELHRLAHRYMGEERPGHTIQTTALINEAYLRLTDYRNIRWQNKAHFFAIAAQVMRRILVDYARRRHYAKRGGGAFQVSLDEAMVLSEDTSAELIALEEALNDLAVFDPQKSQIVELRFFGGLNTEETAEVLEISPTTVKREWQRAKAWLYLAINKGVEGGK
ncbi:MAG: sigma-70 family RNA polymerase sigma factor [Acidobacteriia bacterium]|nr:sigma-70 family RNA polymerase sigma factor [Terriglobia bacterium]